MSRLTTTLGLALSALALAACGGDDEAATESSSEAGGGAGPALVASAVPDGSLEFEQESLEAKPGVINVTFDNPAPIAHDFCVEDPDDNNLGCTELIADGDTDVAEYDLEPGEYTYYCSVAGHRDGGMEGTLTVE